MNWEEWFASYKDRETMSLKRAIEILTEEVEDYLPENKWKEYEAAVDKILKELEVKNV